MENKRMMYQQRTLNFEALESKELAHVAETTSEPPPADQGRQKPPPLIRPDRQIVYADSPNHFHWPDAKPLHDHDTITVDRITDDIDGPAHRFVIKRGDTVEAYMAHDNFHVGQVIGVSHARQEVRVAWDDTLEKGGWFHVGRIYPAAEKDELPSPALRDRRAKLSALIESVNARYGNGLIETDRVPPTEEPPAVVINDGLIIVPVGFKETNARVNVDEAKSESPITATMPYTFDEFKAFFRGHSETPVAFEDFQSEFHRIWESQDALKGELASRFKAKELAALASRFGSWTAKRSTKEENAAHVVSKMLAYFVLDDTVSYSPFSGETYELAVKNKVEALTAGEYARHFEKKQEASLAQEKALTNPESFSEFRTFIIDKGEEALSDEQLARYDALHADLSRERRAKETPAVVAKFQNEDLQGVAFTVKEGFHDKRQCPLWIVQLETRVERDAFNELNRKAKMLSGWYSSFKKEDAGFQFMGKENADRFCSLLQGDADRSEVLQARKERKELSAAERLHELAKELFERAEQTIERSNDSLQNTARRADIQAGVRGRAYADQALSRTLHSIAEAMSRGEAQYLDGIRHKSHVETLDAILHRAKWARIRAHKQAPRESRFEHGRRVDRIENEPAGPVTVRFAEYPYPYFYKRTLQELVAAGHNRTGVKQAAQKMAKRLAREREDGVTFKAEHDIAAVLDFIERAKASGVDTERAAMATDDYKRLQRAGITDIHELRAALREYLGHRGEARGDSPVQIAERELIGMKLPGFFPTPRPVIEQMLELADIEPQHRVLEPSCGKGDILDAIKENFPEASVHAIEFNRTLSDVLSAKGYEVEYGDFLEHQGVYERILMNPPFEHGADMTHIEHAYSLLAPGGRLVSVISEGPFFRSDKQSVSFRAWLDGVAGETEELPEDAFRGREAFRETGVRTRLLTVCKPCRG